MPAIACTQTHIRAKHTSLKSAWDECEWITRSVLFSLSLSFSGHKTMGTRKWKFAGKKMTNRVLKGRVMKRKKPAARSVFFFIPFMHIKWRANAVCGCHKHCFSRSSSSSYTMCIWQTRKTSFPQLQQLFVEFFKWTEYALNQVNCVHEITQNQNELKKKKPTHTQQINLFRFSFGLSSVRTFFCRRSRCYCRKLSLEEEEEDEKNRYCVEPNWIFFSSLNNQKVIFFTFAGKEKCLQATSQPDEVVSFF